MNTIRDRIPIETLLRQYIDETQEVETTKVEKIVERPVNDRPVHEKPAIEPKINIRPIVNTDMFNESNTEANTNANTNANSIFNANATTNFKSFNENITVSEPEPRIKFSENNSVLTFESPAEPISLGEIMPIDDFEVLDLSGSEKINIDFEEL
jgi:hypothetical protein